MKIQTQSVSTAPISELKGAAQEQLPAAGCVVQQARDLAWTHVATKFELSDQQLGNLLSPVPLLQP